jgi:hypothetical protein
MQMKEIYKWNIPLISCTVQVYEQLQKISCENLGQNRCCQIFQINPQKAILGIRTSKATWGQMWVHHENGYN